MSTLTVRSRLFVALSLALAVTACSDRSGPTAGPTAPEVQAAVLPGTAQFDQEVGAALAAQARFGDELMTRPGVVGTAVGLDAAGRPGLIVLVENASVDVPGRLGGVGVRPLITGTIHALQEADPRAKGGGRGGGGGTVLDRTARLPRPVPIGVSTGHPSITAGTIGARVTNGTSVFALSNNHVYADVNTASIGAAVIQPGTFDGGAAPDDNIGTLADFEPIRFTQGSTNVIDAAIALTTTELLGNSTGGDGYGVPSSTWMVAVLNMSVQKCGRTTGCTSGKVAGINATVDVDYGAPHGVARFVNQIVITPGAFSAGGDSGSLIVAKGKRGDTSDDRKPVGLLFAGSFSATIANPIDSVLTRFGVTIDGN